MSKITPRLLTLAVLIVFAAAARFIPHEPNFSPLMAIALFGGVYFSDKRLAFLLPFAVIFLTDIFLGIQPLLLGVYLSFGLIVMLGFLLRKKLNAGTLLLSAVGGAVIFFIVSNFGVWLLSGWYLRDLSGLVYCYEMALPFFRNTLFSSVLFSGVLFGTFYLAEKRFPALSAQAK